SKPAPMIKPKPLPRQSKPSIIGRIFSWFTGNAKADEKPVAPPARESVAHRRGQPPRREQRGRANNSPEQRWQQRNGQRPRDPDRNQQRQQQRDRPKRDMQPRPSRPEPVPSAEGARTEPPRENAQRHEGMPPGRRRRGGRRGGRHEVRETQPVGQDAIGQIPASIAATPADVVTAETHPLLATVGSSAFQEQDRQKDLSFEFAPVADTPFRVPDTDIQVPADDGGIAPSEPFPAAEEPPQRAVEAEPAPLVALDLTPTNLVQIETSAEKARAVSNHVEPQPPPRPPRVRPPSQQPASEEEPLVQIETQK